MKRKILIILGLICFSMISFASKHPALKDFEDNLKLLQSGKFNEVLSKEEIGTNEDLFKVFSEGYKKITYKINKSSEKNGEYLINVTMKAPDMTGNLEDFIQKVMTYAMTNLNKSDKEMEADIEEMLISSIKSGFSNPKIKYRENTFDVVYSKVGNNWEMDTEKNSELMDMITFGYLSSLK